MIFCVSHLSGYFICVAYFFVFATQACFVLLWGVFLAVSLLEAAIKKATGRGSRLWLVQEKTYSASCRARIGAYLVFLCLVYFIFLGPLRPRK